ncbi:MAG: transposase [Rhizobiales bacterium]|nr:transposase [Hyphomicrobiales bacterium]
MRRSQFTDNEILHLLYEASTGVSVAEICSTAGISLRTYYRWRSRFGGLNAPAVMRMKELAAENARLRGLVSNLFERLRDPSDNPSPSPAAPANGSTGDNTERKREQAIRSAAKKCGGAVTGRFASLRVHP